MARLTGARNSDYDARRNDLIVKVRDRLAVQDGHPPSFRELALAAAVSVATLRHYFGTREQLVRAVFAASRGTGERHLARARASECEGLEPSLRLFLDRVVQGWTVGQVGVLHRIGLSEGLRSPGTGLDYLVDILEPILQALEVRLVGHIEAGTMVKADTRHAALMLLSPIVLALLHQHDLGGTRCRPLDLAALIEEHLKVFVRAYRP